MEAKASSEAVLSRILTGAVLMVTCALRTVSTCQLFGASPYDMMLMCCGWSSQADRAGQAEEYAQLYEASSLRRQNDSRLEQVGSAV